MVAGAAAPSPLVKGGASPALRGRASLGLLVSPSPLTQHKSSPVHAVSCAFKPTAEELEEFTLDETPSETPETCRCCGGSDVWVDVVCFADGTSQCSCAQNPNWALCESCCELLVHDECVASQMANVQAQRGIAPAKEADVLPAGGEAFYEGLLADGDASWQGQEYNPYAEPDPFVQQTGSWNMYAPANPYAAGYGDYGGPARYTGAHTGPMGMGYYPPPVPTVVDLQNMGADLSQICVEFAANGRCPRGPTCRWIHCKV